MAWYLVKCSDNFIFYFTFYNFMDKECKFKLFVSIDNFSFVKVMCKPWEI
jgi:hypothetical protein